MAPSSGATVPAPPTEHDRVAVRAMIGRPPRGEPRIVARCPLGLPEVIEVPPVLPDGTPFPTMYWLTCPLAVLRVGRLESTGIMREWEDQLDLAPSNAAYRERRDARLAQLGVPEGTPVPVGGVGGSHGGVKCLHARYAWWRAGGDDPAGARAAEYVGDLDCTAQCTTAEGIRIQSPTESGGSGGSGGRRPPEVMGGSGGEPALTRENPATGSRRPPEVMGGSGGEPALTRENPATGSRRPPEVN